MKTSTSMIALSALLIGGSAMAQDAVPEAHFIDPETGERQVERQSWVMSGEDEAIRLEGGNEGRWAFQSEDGEDEAHVVVRRIRDDGDSGKVYELKRADKQRIVMKTDDKDIVLTREAADADWTVRVNGEQVDWDEARIEKELEDADIAFSFDMDGEDGAWFGARDFEVKRHVENARRHAENALEHVRVMRLHRGAMDGDFEFEFDNDFEFDFDFDDLEDMSDEERKKANVIIQRMDELGPEVEAKVKAAMKRLENADVHWNRSGDQLRIRLERERDAVERAQRRAERMSERHEDMEQRFEVIIEERAEREAEAMERAAEQMERQIEALERRIEAQERALEARERALEERERALEERERALERRRADD